MNGLVMKYFVLKPAGNDGYALASRNAMLAYAEVMDQVDPDLANDLRAWVARESVGRNISAFDAKREE